MDSNENDINIKELLEIQLMNTKVPKEFVQSSKWKDTDSDKVYSSTQSREATSRSFNEKEEKKSKEVQEFSFSKVILGEPSPHNDEIGEPSPHNDEIGEPSPHNDEIGEPGPHNDEIRCLFHSIKEFSILLHSTSQFHTLKCPKCSVLFSSIYSLQDLQDLYSSFQKLRIKKKTCLICHNIFSFATYSEVLSCDHLCLSCSVNLFKLGGTECPCCKVRINCTELNIKCFCCQDQNLKIGISLCPRSFYCVSCAMINITQKKCSCCNESLNNLSFNKLLAIEILKKLI